MQSEIGRDLSSNELGAITDEMKGSKEEKSRLPFQTISLSVLSTPIPTRAFGVPCRRPLDLTFAKRRYLQSLAATNLERRAD